MVYVIGIVAALIILFGFLCYKKAPPTEAIVVTGFGLSKPKVVCGKGTFVLPVLQRADRLNMRLLKIDVKTPETGVKTKNGVSLWIDSVVTIQVYSENSTVLDEEVKASGLKDAKAYIMSRQQAAISNFLGMNEQGINEKVNDVLQGNLREIVSDMTVDQILTNRKQMAVSVIENARKAEILAAYKNSVPLKEMIAKFNVAEGYCSMVANDAGLTENRRNERIKIRQKPRNENIFREYESGVPVQKLSEKYQLSVPGIYKVIQRVRRQKEAMSLAMDCEANQIERI